jgi:hypothetical protein
VNNKSVLSLIIGGLVILGFIFFLVSDDDDDYYFGEDLFSEISYEVPSKFEGDEDYSYSRYYNYDDDSLYCYFRVSASEKEYYDDLEDWFKEMITFSLSDKVSDLKEVSINDSKMYYIDKKSNGNIEYYYGVESSNYYYLLTYSIDDFENGDRSDLDSNFCYNSKDRILSSVKVK